MLKKILFIIFLPVLVSILFPGCSLSAGGVRLAGKKEMTVYAKSIAGKVKYIKAVKGKNKIDYYFREPVTGIEFTATTYASSVGLDGAAFYYKESKKNDFYEKYSDRIMKTIQPALDAIQSENENIIIEKDISYRGGDALLNVSFIHYEENFTEDDVIKTGQRIGDILDGKDPLGKYNCIKLCDGHRNLLGNYILGSKEYIPKEDHYDENMNEYFERMIHMHGYAGENKPKVHSVFLRKEETRVGDIPGIENVSIMQNVIYDYIPDITYDTVVTLYYYEFDGKEYFVADHIHIDSEYDRGKLYIGIRNEK